MIGIRKLTVTPMRSSRYLLLSVSFSLLFFGVNQSPAEAAKRRSGGGGGGVFLQTPNPQTPVEHNNRGVELGQKGLWPDAIREHETALQMDPHNVQWRTNLSAAHLEYGKYLSAHGRKAEAMAEFRRAMIIDPANAQADAELDNVLRSLKKDPLDYTYRHSLADDADISGQYDTAIVEYRKCVKMRDDPLSHASLGRVLIKAGKTVEGYKKLRDAVGRNDWAADQRNELAKCHVQLGDILKEFALKAKDQGKGTKGMQRLANAAVEYRRAVTLNPSDGAAISGLVAVSQMALAIRPSFDNHLYMAGAYLLAGKFANAQMEYNECYKLKPRAPELSAARLSYHQAVARSPMASQEQVADSIAKIKKLVDEDSENARLWYILGRLREAQHDYEKAKKSYDKALSINPLIDPDLKQALVRIGAAPAETASAGGTGAGSAPEKTPEQSKAALQKAMKEQQYVELEGMVEKGEHDAVISKGTELFKKEPTDGRIPGIIGRAYQKKAQSEPAQAVEHANSAKTWFRIGAGLGDANSARFLEQVDADRVQSKIAEAEELFKQAKYLEAKSIYQDVIIMAPKRGDVHRKLGDCLKGLGDAEGAKKEYEDADRVDRGLKPIAESESAPTPASGAAKEAPAAGKKAIAKTEKPPEEGGMKAEELKMTPLKKK